MRVPAVSVASKIVVAAFAALMMLAFIPVDAFAEGEGAPSAPLASSLMDGSASVVREDVALAVSEDDATLEPVIGSFTVDGMTFAVIDDSCVEFVGIAPSVILSEAAEGGVVEGSDSDQVSEVGLANLVLPETVSYEGSEYALASIAPYAFYLSGATSVMLPASVSDVDDRAFRSSNVANVAVAEGNPNYSSYDGALYDAEQLSLLLIPEGKQGTVRIPKTAEVAEASVFSHCPLADSISVDAGSAAFASENGLLYDSNLTTLLRVPAGATEITIREGCTTIAAGALEACASLATINAPATVTSISPGVFTSVPTVSLPAASAILGDGLEAAGPSVTLSEAAEGGEVEGPDEGQASEAGDQLTAMVALSSTDDGLPEVSPTAISLKLSPGADASPWRFAGFAVEETQDDAGLSEEAAESEPDLPVASLDSASTYAGAYDITVVNAEGSTLYKTNASGSTNTPIDSRVIGCGEASHQVHVRFLDKGGSLIVQLWHSKTTDDSYYRWVKPGYVLVGVKVTNGAGTISDEIRATEVGTSYSGPSSIKGAGRTISPIFEKVTYTVPLDKNGGTGGSDNVANVQYGSAMPSITPPTKAGYAFMGYYWSANGGGTQHYDQSGKSAHAWDRCVQYPESLSTSVTLSSSYRLVAYWDQSVTVKGGGGTVSYFNAHLDDPSKLVESGLSEKVLTGVGTPNLVYGGNANRCIHYTSGGSPWGIYVSRPGYTFLGWDGVGPDGSQFSVDASTGNKAVVVGATYTAKWGGPYTATIKAGGGQLSHFGSSDPVVTEKTATWSEGATYVYGSSLDRTIHWHVDGRLNGVMAQRPGYTFLGWEGVRADGSKFTVDSSTGNKPIEPGATYTAKWGGPYTATIKAGGGQLSHFGSSDPVVTEKTATWSEGATYVYGSSLDRTIHWHVDGRLNGVMAQRPGYTFLGWEGVRADGSKFTVDSSTGNKPIEPGATYTAKWGGPWSATFKAAGGSIDIYSAYSNNDPAQRVESGLSEKQISWVSGANAVYGQGPNYGVVHFPIDGGFRGLYAGRPGYSFQGWSGVDADGKTFAVNASTGSRELTAGATYTATWSANTYQVSFDANNGSGGQEAKVSATYASSMPDISSTPPKREGYSFVGWYDNPDYTKGVQYYNAKGQGARAYDKAEDCTLYAGWSPWPTAELDAGGGTLRIVVVQQNENADGSHSVGEVIAEGQQRWTFDFENLARVYDSLVHYWRWGYLYEVRPAREGYRMTGWTGSHTVNSSTGSVGVNNGDSYQAEWSPNDYTIEFVNQEGEAVDPIEATYDADVTLPAPEARKGYIFEGWNTASDGSGSSYKAGVSLSKPNFVESGTVTLYAQWSAAIRADAPISATVRLDVLGVEDQAMDEEEPGYLESRCGEPLKVAEVSFEKKPGATDLFGAHVPDIELQALPGKDASWATDAPAFSFALDAAGDAATEDDATKLAPLSMSGYEVRIPISYRFLIPDALLDEVLGAIDPATFEDKKTPVCSVVYTVALQSPPV